MPRIETHWLIGKRAAPPVFGRVGYEYFEIDQVEGEFASVERDEVARLEQRQIHPSVTRVTLRLDGFEDRTLDDLYDLPKGEAAQPSLGAVGKLPRYSRSHGAQLNTALLLGFAKTNGSTLIFDTFQLDEDEEIYGLGERNLSIRLRGTRERLWIGDPYVNTTNTMVYLSLPLVMSTAGWGVAVLHGGGVIVEAGNPTADALTVAVEGGLLDYLVFEADDLAGVVRLVGETFGMAKMPPDWSFGVWMSRLMYFSRAEVEEMIDRLTDDGFPVDVVHLDPYWHKAEFVDPAGADRSTLVWNDDDFGPLDDFFAEMKRRRVRISLWESPYFSFNNTSFPEAKEHKLLVTDSNGEIVSPQEFLWKGGILDVTNPEAVTWFQDRHRPLLRAGAAVMKTDFGESIPADAVFHDGRSGREAHHLYPLIYHRAVADVCRQERGEDFVLWARSGFFGSAQHDIPWVGDSVSTWSGMICALRSVLSLSLSGYPFVSVDIGGFILWDDLIGPPSADLFVRWSQWGLLLSHSRFHGVGGREPVLIDEPERTIVREMCLTRMSLLPYIKKVCEEATISGAPVARPLVFTWPDDRSARDDELTYTFGPSILVAPVYRPDGYRAHYLPEGVWIDFFTGEKFDGGSWRTEQYPLERFPLYLRDGDEVPRADPALRAEDVLNPRR